MQNDYDKIACDYKATDEKPDKKYSMLPTVLDLAGDLSGKKVLDLGCGSGFFTMAFAKSSDNVVGIDNSSEQLKLAKKIKVPNIEYIEGDIFKTALPHSDIVLASFVLGYAQNEEQLDDLCSQIFDCLSTGGKFISIVDLPAGHDLKRFGARKILHEINGEKKIEIILFNEDTEICRLWANYYSKESIGLMLRAAGFKKIQWHKPIISFEGMEALGGSFWKGYDENCELGYLTAEK